jgi:hypothetical protein
MARVKGTVQACYDQYKVPGLATVQLSIANSGRVANAQVTGKFGGTPTGDCVARAVRGAQFPRFRGSTMSITYPFMLR